MAGQGEEADERILKNGLLFCDEGRSVIMSLARFDHGLCVVARGRSFLCARCEGLWLGD